MNVCIVTSWFPSSEHPNIAPFVYDFAKNLGRLGLTVSVITTIGKGGDRFRIKDDVTIHRVGGKFPVLPILKLIGPIKPDILHIHAPNLFSSAAIVVASLKRIPMVATLHRAEVDTVGKPISLVRKYALSRFDKIIAVSNFTRTLALNAGVDKDKIKVIYNSCNETLFSRKEKSVARRKCEISTEQKVILYVGNLIKIKGIYTLIESFVILRTKLTDFLAIIIGQGIEQNKIESLVKTYGLSDNVRCIGWLAQNELPDFYNASDVFVLPSLIEGNSVASLEAMASGLPIVASKIPANEETIIDGVNGFLFESGNARDLAEKISIVLTNYKLQMGMSLNCCRVYFQKFSVINQIEMHSKIYSSLVRA